MTGGFQSEFPLDCDRYIYRLIIRSPVSNHFKLISDTNTTCDRQNLSDLYKKYEK
jgi:hypothetical protein